MNRKLLSTIGWGYSILLIYASLMPFDFSFVADMSYRTSHFWRYWPINPGARISGSDLISNLALYVPLGWILAVRFRLGNIRPFLSLAAAGLICFVISLCVELLQMFTISRVSSASDWLLNTISGGTGGALGIFYGKSLWINGIRWLKLSWETRPVIIAAVLLAGLIAADSLSPYMPTILLKQVWQSFKASNFNIVQGVSLHPWHWWVVQRIMVYFVMTLVFAGAMGKKSEFKRFIWGACLVGLFALFLELGKLFIVSRSFNIANVLTAWIGCFCAIWIGWAVGGRVNTRQKLEWSMGFIFLYLFYLAWFPFDFAWDYSRIQNVFSSPIRLLPLYDYAMGSTLNHARLFVQSIFLLGVLIYIIRIRFNWFEKRKTGIWLAAIFCGMLGFFQEGGQLFLPSRTPSATDIYCFTFGGAMGAWVCHPLHRLSPKP
jgi:VanZ family protein